MTPSKGRYALPAGVTMSAQDAAKERATDDATAIAGSCPYEADLLDAEYLRELGFYPAVDVEPPF